MRILVGGPGHYLNSKAEVAGSALELLKRHASQCAIEVLSVAQTRRLINLAEVSPDQLEPR